MKKKHLLRSILAIALCILMIGTVIAVGYTIYENVQGKKVVIDKDNNLPVVKPSNGSVSAPVTAEVFSWHLPVLYCFLQFPVHIFQSQRQIQQVFLPFALQYQR